MQKQHASRKAFGYLRVSTSSQVKDGDSLAVQHDLIHAICKLEGYDLQALFAEEAVSGDKPFAERPMGKRVLEAAAAGDVIVALRLDRCFRNTQDALATLAALKRRGVQLHLKDIGGLISDDSVSHLIFSLMSSVSSFERRRIQERVLEARAALRAQKRFLGGSPQFAYRLVEIDGKTFVEVDQAMLDEVMRLKRQGHSTRQIAGVLAQRGVRVTHHAVARCLKRLAAA